MTIPPPGRTPTPIHTGLRGVLRACAAILVLVAAPAAAQPRLTPEFQSGDATPIGYYGLNLDVQPLRWLSVTGGFGWSNFGGSSQLQLALVPRLRWPVLPWLAVGAGAAFSRGERGDDPAGVREMGHRLGPELSVELAPLPRARLRLVTGLAYGLDAGQGHSSYVGLAVGWSVLQTEETGLLPPTPWYGWQTLLADAGAGALLLLSDPSETGSGTGLRYAAYQQAPVVYLAGGPIVHLTHRRPLRAGASLLIRTGLVAAAFFLLRGSDQSECVRFDCRSHRWMVAAAGAAAGLDAAWLGWER